MITAVSNSIQEKRKTGRPHAINWQALANDDAKSLEVSKVQWQELALRLAHECQAYLKKKENPPPQLLTQAAIAYDKAFAKRDVSDTQVTIPKSLELAWIKALRQPVSTSDNARYGKLEPGQDPCPAPNRFSIDSQLAQAPAQEPTPTPTPGVGLQPVPVLAAAAAQPDLSPDLKTEISLELQKDPAPTHSGAEAVACQQAERRETELVTSPPDPVPARVKHTGPRKFVNPFKDQV